MRLLTKVLDVAYRRIAPEGLLTEILEPDLHSLESETERIQNRFKASFLAMAELTLAGYSHDEQENIYAYFEQQEKCHAEGKGQALFPFHLLLELANSSLEGNEDSPICKFSETLHWRDAYLLLGQDIFTTAWLASRHPTARKPISFSWPSTIPVKYPALDRLTKGITENHLHLYAGASTFSLSWSCLMNHPETIMDFEKSMEGLLQINASRETRGTFWPFSRRMLYAAKIRELLFRALQIQDAFAQQSCHTRALAVRETALPDRHTDILEELRAFHRSYASEEYTAVELEKSIKAVRSRYGLAFEQPRFALPVCLDYAFTAALAEEEHNPSRLLASERYLLYLCFQRCFTGELHLLEQWLFYVYLVLKTQFRGELVQVNRQTGFHNFKAYDQRKKTIWKKYPGYLNEDICQAINTAQYEQGIAALEGRICPENTDYETVAQVHKIDQTKLLFDEESFAKRWTVNTWYPSYGMLNLAKDEAYSFIFHFPKEKDRPLSPDEQLMRCRHKKYRQQLRSDSIHLARALSNYAYLRERIVGIDACSNEIGCRPEVFAQTFRFLRNFPVAFYNAFSYEYDRAPLSATYHVGEDFLDIADGLRAMDETVWFLNLSRGDRFGHALALGVNPRLHYKKKHSQIILPKQDLLDNLVWLCSRSVELGVDIPSNLRCELLNRAEQLYWDIYGKVNAGNAFSLEQYYHSIQLRGDAPELYRTGNYEDILLSDPYDSFAKNENASLQKELAFFRKRAEITKLYFLYHYSRDAKVAGAKLETMEISPEYIQLMWDMQLAMQRYLSGIGISIECNPSSNVLIGTFSSYQNHPVLNFYNIGLNVPHQDVQMHVSINTDDPGVFDTSLKFEYALLARAIGELRDEQGKPIHNEREIEDYIYNLVQMGQEQSFTTRART